MKRDIRGILILILTILIGAWWKGEKRLKKAVTNDACSLFWLNLWQSFLVIYSMQGF